jgi:pimeloyl-ACP methyl ester carboxylesterase
MRPEVLALPGTLLDARSLAAALEGAGLPPPRVAVLGESATLEEELARLAGLVHAPAVWVGHSLGGIVALHLAVAQPQVVAGLVLLGANARAGRDTSAVRREAQWQLAQQQGLAALARGKLAAGYAIGEDAGLIDALAVQAETVGLRRFRHQLDYAAQRPGLLAPRQTLPVPLLALSASEDGLCPPADGAVLASLSPQGQHHTLAGGGHLFPLQQPAWVARYLRRFLNTFEETPP